MAAIATGTDRGSELDRDGDQVGANANPSITGPNGPAEAAGRRTPTLASPPKKP